MAESLGRAFWVDAVQRFDRGDWTVAEFCDEIGCAVPTFYSWRKRLRGDRLRRPEAFTELIVQASPPTVAKIEVQLGDGTILRLTGVVDEASLAAVVRVLSEQAAGAASC